MLPSCPDATRTSCKLGHTGWRWRYRRSVSSSGEIVVHDGERRCAFDFEAMLDYHGGGSPGGVAHAFKVMERAFPLLIQGRDPDRRTLRIRSAFGGPGARDAFELVTRAVSDGRFRLDPALARPERGVTLERFVFVVCGPERAVTLAVREGFVPDELIALARVEGRSPAEEARFTAVKRETAALVMAHPATEVYDAAVSPS
jgi:hypothetical protein